MYDIDYNRVGLLMMIVEKQVTVLPKATALAGAALRELNEINEMALENQREIAEEERAAQAEIDAERQHADNVARLEKGEDLNHPNGEPKVIPNEVDPTTTTRRL